MSDEYIAALAAEELRVSCPGPAGCHGYQNWCPECGTVSHVCDDPQCDAHRRDTDVLKELEETTERLRHAAKECKKIEDMMRSSEGDNTTDMRIELRRMTARFESGEKATSEIEGELREIRAPGSNLVPRKEGSRLRPRGR
jgi:hypothetical protein